MVDRSVLGIAAVLGALVLMSRSKAATVEPMPTPIPTPGISGVRIAFGSSNHGAALWDASIYDLTRKQWIGGAPGGAKDLTTPCDFAITEKVFLIKIMELPPSPVPGPYWSGPYFVTVPRLNESYTWDGQTGTLLGATGTIDMPMANNESEVTAVVEGFSWKSEGVWGVSLKIETAKDVGEAENWARFFPTIMCDRATLPLDELRAPVIHNGDRITCRIRLEWDVYSAVWSAWDFKKPSAYPSEAYNFTGSIQVGGVVRKQYAPEYAYPDFLVWADFRQIYWGVSGGVPPFAVAIIYLGMFGNVLKIDRKIGPVSGIYEVQEDAYQLRNEGGLALYAHPNPNAPEWGEYNWEVNGWKQVA